MVVVLCDKDRGSEEGRGDVADLGHCFLDNIRSDDYILSGAGLYNEENNQELHHSSSLSHSLL